MTHHSCRCRGACGCMPRIMWTVGVSSSHHVPCPLKCDAGACGDCCANDKLLASSQLVIYHECLAAPVAVLDDVLTIGRCNCTVNIPADIAELTAAVNSQCNHCVFKYKLLATIYREEPTDENPTPDTCGVQVIEHGELVIDWTLAHLGV